MSKGIFTKIDGELKQIKNLWTKVNGILVDSIIPKSIISGVVKDFINYTIEYDVARTDIGIGSGRIDYLFLNEEDYSKFTVKVQPGSSSKPSLRFLVMDAAQGDILTQFDTPEKVRLESTFFKQGDYIYTPMEIYNSLWEEYDIHFCKVNLITGVITSLDIVSGNLYDAKFISANEDFVAYTRHYSPTRPDINNSIYIMRKSDGVRKSPSFTRSGLPRQLEPYDDKFIIITGGGEQSYGYYTQQFWFGEDDRAASRQLYLGSKDLVKPPVMAIDGDIAYVVAERLIKKINLVDLTLIEDYQVDISRYSNLVLDRTNKLMHIIHSTSSSRDPTISVLDYANNYELIYTYELEPGFRPVQLASDKDGIFFRTTQILSRKLFNNLGGEV